MRFVKESGNNSESSRRRRTILRGVIRLTEPCSQDDEKPQREALASHAVVRHG